MLSSIPSYVSITFFLTTLVTLAFFLFAMLTGQVKRSTAFFVVGLTTMWLTILGIITYNGFLRADLYSFPPRFAIVVIVPVFTIATTFLTNPGRQFIDSLSLKNLTLLSVVRIPVEMSLFWLAVYKAVPELMTFAGRNFDILAGLSAPIIFYFGYIKEKISKKGILVWNIVCLLLLLNIVGNAIFSVPSSFQQFGLDQPNIGILYFPFSWLPGFVAPLVLFSHLVAIRRLR